MARISADEAAAQIGNRFMLVLVASQRARELKNGSTKMVSDNDASVCTTALREIEEGKYTLKDYYGKIEKKQRKGHRDEYHIT